MNFLLGGELISLFLEESVALAWTATTSRLWQHDLGGEQVLQPLSPRDHWNSATASAEESIQDVYPTLLYLSQNQEAGLGILKEQASYSVCGQMDNKAGSVCSSLTSALSWVNPSNLRSLKGVRKNGRERLCSAKTKECLWQVFFHLHKKVPINLANQFILWQFCPASLAFVPQPLALGSETLFFAQEWWVNTFTSVSLFCLSSMYQHLQINFKAGETIISIEGKFIFKTAYLTKC